MASHNATAAAAGDEPGGLNRQDYCRRVANLPPVLQTILTRVAVDLRATTTAAAEAAEAVAWCADLLPADDLRAALVSAMLDRRTAKGARR